MIYAFHISTKSALFPSFNKGSKEIKEAGEGGREEGKKRARKASGLKRKKNVILLVKLLIYMENSTLSTKLS